MEIDTDPVVEEHGIISSHAERPYSLPIAVKPMASSYSIVANWANGVKIVGFVMVGGTPEQFENSVRLQRLKNERFGWRSGPFIHARSGTYLNYDESR